MLKVKYVDTTEVDDYAAHLDCNFAEAHVDLKLGCVALLSLCGLFEQITTR